MTTSKLKKRSNHGSRSKFKEHSRTKTKMYKTKSTTAIGTCTTHREYTGSSKYREQEIPWPIMCLLVRFSLNVFWICLVITFCIV